MTEIVKGQLESIFTVVFLAVSTGSVYQGIWACTHGFVPVQTVFDNLTDYCEVDNNKQRNFINSSIKIQKQAGVDYAFKNSSKL